MYVSIHFKLLPDMMPQNISCYVSFVAFLSIRVKKETKG